MDIFGHGVLLNGINDYGRRLSPAVAAAPSSTDNNAEPGRRTLRRRAGDISRRVYCSRAGPRFYRILCKISRRGDNVPHIMLRASISGPKYGIGNNRNIGRIKFGV